MNVEYNKNIVNVLEKPFWLSKTLEDYIFILVEPETKIVTVALHVDTFLM